MLVSAMYDTIAARIVSILLLDTATGCSSVEALAIQAKMIYNIKQHRNCMHFGFYCMCAHVTTTMSTLQVFIVFISGASVTESLGIAGPKSKNERIGDFSKLFQGVLDSSSDGRVRQLFIFVGCFVTCQLPCLLQV